MGPAHRSLDYCDSSCLAVHIYTCMQNALLNRNGLVMRIQAAALRMAITGTIIARAVLLLYIVGGMEARSGVGHTMPPDAVLGRHVCTSDKVRSRTTV